MLEQLSGFSLQDKERGDHEPKGLFPISNSGRHDWSGHMVTGKKRDVDVGFLNKQLAHFEKCKNRNSLEPLMCEAKYFTMAEILIIAVKYTFICDGCECSLFLC